MGSILGFSNDGVLFGRSSDNFAVPYSPGEICEIGTGLGFYVLLTKEGSLYVWGDNLHGELGIGDLSVQDKPVFLNFENDPLQDIAVGPNHILAVSRSGKLLAWGDNSQYQLGLPDINDIMVPTIVEIPEEVVSVYTGFTHSYVFGKSGRLYAFGSNRYGQLFTGSQEMQKSPAQAEVGRIPACIEEVVYPQFSEERIKKITGTRFLTESGKVFTIGTSYYAKLGTGNIDTVYYPPVYIPLPEKVIDLDEGMFAVTALTENGHIYNWGYNQNHALGREHAKWYYSPKRLAVPEKIVKIHGGIENIAALSESGSWYLWGDNTYGGLMTGDMNPTAGPVKITTPETFTDIAPGAAHCLALTAAGEVYIWGSYQVRIGDGDTLVREVEVDDLKYRKISFPEAIIKIEVGDKECFALSETGNLYVWGYNELGVLGLGEDDERVLPLIEVDVRDDPVVVLEQVKDFSVSPEVYSVLAVTRTGEVYIWGETGYDDDLHYLYSNSPKKIDFPEAILQVFCGDGVFFAIGHNDIYTWGYNYFTSNGAPLQEPVIVQDTTVRHLGE